ncbi:MAG: OmpA family protein [Myxococcota bacterium]
MTTIETESVTTRRWIVNDSPTGWWPWGILWIFLFLLLCLLALFWLAPVEIEPQVEREVRTRMERAGYPDAEVRVSGQHATVTATVAQPLSHAESTQLLDYLRATQCDTVFGPYPCTSRVVLELHSPAPKPEPESVPEPLPTQPVPAPVVATQEVRDTCNADFAAVLEKSTINFEIARATLKPSSDSVLEAVAEIANRCPGTLRVEGHTDSTGDPNFNTTLSLERAKAVVSALGQLGVESERLQPLGFGSSRPRASNGSEADRARNRRIEIVLTEPNGVTP